MTALASATPVSFVNVVDHAKAMAFYRDTLGMAHKSADEHGDFFEFGGGLMRLTALPDWKASGHPTIGWDVDDIDAAVAALNAKGIEMLIYPGMGQEPNGIWRSGDVAVAWFADPDGNCLSLSQTP